MAVRTEGLVAEYVGKLAKNGTLPGNNSDPTSVWTDVVGANDGTLTGFPGTYTTDNGWAGAGTAGDPYRLQMGSAEADNLVNLGTGAAFDLTSSASWEFWAYKIGTSGATYGRLIDKRGASTTTGYAIYVSETTGQVGINATFGGVNKDQVFTGGTPIEDGLFHVIVTYSDATDLCYCYLNGADDGSGFSTTTGGLATNAVNCCLGNRDSDSLRQFSGYIATARIYNVWMTTADAYQNYSAGVTASSLDGLFSGLTVTRQVNG